jgi:NitT/TauT family transport system permease protein
MSLSTARADNRPARPNRAGRLVPAPLRWLIRPPVIAVVVIIAIWWVLSIGQPRYLLPGPPDVFSRFFDLTVTSRNLWGALTLSLAALLLGGVLAFLIGVPLGILMGANKNIEHIFGPYVNAFYVAPVSALTPLFVWWLGIGLAPRVATVFVFAAPVIILTCYRGARETPRTLVEAAQVFGASSRQIFSKTIVPHAIPYIITASRLGLGRAIKGTVLAELVVSITGLGEMISEAAHVFDTPTLMATLLFLLLLGVVATAILARFEVAITPWRQSER